MAGVRGKPAFPRVYRRTGGPIFWALMEGPRRTFPGDTGDVSDLMRGTSAAPRQSGCTWTNGPHGPRLNFVGTSPQWVEWTVPKLPVGGAPRTILATIQLTVVGGGVVVFNYGNIAAYGNSFLLLVNSSGQLQADYYGGGATSTVVVNDGKPHRIGVSVGATNATYQFWVDGVAIPTSPNAGTGVTTINTAAGTPFTLGEADAAYGRGTCFTGQIDNLQIYDRILSTSEGTRDNADPLWRLRRPSTIARLFAPAAGWAPRMIRPRAAGMPFHAFD